MVITDDLKKEAFSRLSIKEQQVTYFGFKFSCHWLVVTLVIFVPATVRLGLAVQGQVLVHVWGHPVENAVGPSWATSNQKEFFANE